MRAFALLSCLIMAGLAPNAGPSDMTAARIPDQPSQIGRGTDDQQSLVTEDQVRTWLNKWQRRLGLEDWTIDAKIVRIWELPQNSVANIHWSLPKHKATIKVLSSVDSNLRKAEIPRDTELSVVHELIHLSMAKLPLDPNHTELEEDTVKRISTALLDLQDREQAGKLHASNQTRASE